MMAVIALLCLVAGVILGNGVLPGEVSAFIGGHSETVLYVLMLSVGISVGSSRGTLSRLREHHLKILLIPLGIIGGSLMGGAICALLMGAPMGESLMIVSGLGWYSLSGILLTELAGPQAGAMAFLCNLMREIFAFLTIPFLAKYFNGYTALAPCAATSEDTTLPMLTRYTSPEVVVMGVVSGVLCSAAVPVLIQMIHDLC